MRNPFTVPYCQMTAFDSVIFLAVIMATMCLGYFIYLMTKK